MNDLIVKTLDNGLTVVLKAVHSAPVISWWMAYRIGSRNERSGQTGISHWVEHMLFKGTERFPAGVLDRAVDRAGGQWNAFTSIDYTMYFATLPSNQIDIALDAEADRMHQALFLPEEVESERTVIIAERQDNENSPLFWLNEEMHAAAFRVHGYHHSIIGDMADLEQMQRDDLYEHYRRHYVPANATAVAVGDFDPEEMFQRIESRYASIPASPAPALFNRPEPEQQGERRVTVELPGHTAFLQISHRVPEACHPDWFALQILDSILTGPGGGVDNKTCRLYRALVKSGIAADISGGMQETIDPFVYTIGATINDGRDPDEAEAIILAEIERLSTEGISDAELNKARKQARAAFAYSTESVTNQAYWLAQSAILGDINWFGQFISQLEAIQVEDVQRVAQLYLTTQRRTTGLLIPTGLGDDDEEDSYS